LGGFDQRRLLKITLRDGETLPDLGAIPGVEVVSQEGRSLVLAFANAEGMAELESRLATLATDGAVTRAGLLYAIEGFGRWTPEDRTGMALGREGLPERDSFALDVELWPQERVDRRNQLVERFGEWLSAEGFVLLDTLVQPSLVMARVRCNRANAARLLNHRDVRTVDLTPRFGIDVQILRIDLQSLAPVLPPLADAPAVTILDSGLTPAHGLVGPAVGDVQGFVSPDRATSDLVQEGHGTFVGGLALYGDVAGAARSGRFVPELRLFSGKVFRDDGTDETEFVERAVEEAVVYFRTEYGCRVFNLSYGDLNKIYDGRHLRGLAYTLDFLSRTLEVLFVTSAGNRQLTDLPNDPTRYPDYLFEDAGRLLDPGTALNVLTVGGVTGLDATQSALRRPDHLETVPLARPGQPSPFTRCGPSIRGAIKPDFVQHAGNVAVDRQGSLSTRGLGVISFNSGFSTGSLFCEAAGTSCASPVVANQAARILSQLPDASPHLLRALMGAHAKWPSAAVELLNAEDTAEGRERLLKAVGYGQVDEEALYLSLDRIVTLFAEERLEADRHHFYEIPVSASWWQGRRERTVSIALAHAPEVRTTRLEYRATKMKFSFVTAASLDEVAAAFRRNRDEGMTERVSNRWIPDKQRSNGTLQVSRWAFRGGSRASRLFVVVTRQDSTWSTVNDQLESYAIAAVLSDPHAEVSLYTELRAALQARVRARLQL